MCSAVMSEQGVEQRTEDAALGGASVEDDGGGYCVMGLFVRKSRTQLQSDGASPRVDSLFTIVCGMMVLKAEVKSKNSSLT